MIWLSKGLVARIGRRLRRWSIRQPGAVSEVESYMADAKQYAPIDGEVSTVIAEPGELIGAGYPVVTLLDMQDMWGLL